MIRRAARTDRNQREIVQGLRRAGASVQIASMVGSGFPDLVIGAYGGNSLIEIKDGRKCASERKLTADQIEFRQSWKGRIVTVETLEQALAEVEHWRWVALTLRGMRS